jgi:hypothetical protein
MVRGRFATLSIGADRHRAGRSSSACRVGAGVPFLWINTISRSSSRVHTRSGILSESLDEEPGVAGELDDCASCSAVNRADAYGRYRARAFRSVVEVVGQRLLDTSEPRTAYAIWSPFGASAADAIDDLRV